jgi:hypothetical protein
MTLAGACNGTGSCAEPVTRACAPYLCGQGGCLTECDGDEDCAEGSCQEHRCAQDAECVDEDTLAEANGALVECAPYRCGEGRCATSCRSVLDCVGGLVCNAQGVCLPPTGPAGAEQEGGCSIRGAAQPSPLRSRRWLGALGLLACLVRRRSFAALAARLG